MFISVAHNPKPAKFNVLRTSAFWKPGCKHRVMDATQEIATAPQPRDWRSLAQRASVEMDSTKLINLVIELNRVLDELQGTFRLKAL
jgi:hypothetical protein